MLNATPRFFIGPMSKNIVDACIKFANTKNVALGLIPSRRQIDYDGGYVNNWTTETFSKYVRSKSKNIILERDHAGPNQGSKADDGWDSLLEDCKYMDMIHLDPWKYTNDLLEGCARTEAMLNFCSSVNPEIKFEIGTEQSIRNFSYLDYYEILRWFRKNISSAKFDNIEYVVVQAGTSLNENTNTGEYNARDLRDQLILLHQMGRINSKEHNGDYQTLDSIKAKFNMGLTSINIAPEFGVDETAIYLNFFRHNAPELLEDWFLLCYGSRKWRKWTDKRDFKTPEEKTKLISITGHYLFSSDYFKDLLIKANPMGLNLNEIVQKQMYEKLCYLHGFTTENNNL